MSRTALDVAETPRALTHIIGIGAAITILLLSLVLPTKVPVIWFERATDFVVSGDVVEFDVTVVKVRDCEPVLKLVTIKQVDGKDVRLYLASIRGAAGRWYETTLEFIDDESPDSSHDPAWWDRIDLGRWRVKIPPRLNRPPLAVKVPMVHLCGESRDVPVARTMGPFKIRSAQASTR